MATLQDTQRSALRIRLPLRRGNRLWAKASIQVGKHITSPLLLRLPEVTETFSHFTCIRTFIITCGEINPFADLRLLVCYLMNPSLVLSALLSYFPVLSCNVRLFFSMRWPFFTGSEEVSAR